MTKRPTRRVRISDIQQNYHSPYIRDAIARYIAKHNNPHLNSRQIEAEAEGIDLQGQWLPVYHKAKFWLGDTDQHQLQSDEWDVVHARPERTDSKGRTIPAQFDTVLINKGNGQYAGVQGYVVGRVKTIFTLPPDMVGQYITSPEPRPRWLACVKWYTQFPRQPHPDHCLYRIKRVQNSGIIGGTVIPLGNIRRSVHLYPNFGRAVPRE